MNRLALAATLLSLAACSSVPVNTAPTTALRDGETCAQAGPCLPIVADNQLFDDATVYVNGARVGQLPGKSSKTFWIRRSSLVEGNCVYAVAVFREAGFTLRESRQCGNTFRLTVGAEGKLWVVPRGAGR